MGEKLINLKQLRQSLISAKGQISGVASAAAAAIEEVAIQKQNKLTGLPSQAVGFDSTGSAVAVPGWSNPNLLDNWYFADPINQRGQTEYSGASAYLIDRWKFHVNQTKYNVSTNTITRLNTEWSGIIQPIPSDVMQFLAGKTVTYSVLIEEATVPVWTRFTFFNTGALTLSGYSAGIDGKQLISVSGIVPETFDTIPQ